MNSLFYTTVLHSSLPKSLLYPRLTRTKNSDKLETFDLKRGLNRDASEFLETFGDRALDSKTESGVRPEKRLQAQIFAEMIAIDPPRAITTMKAWAKFVQLAARTRSAPFETLAEYMPARAIDAGELYAFPFPR